MKSSEKYAHIRVWLETRKPVTAADDDYTEMEQALIDLYDENAQLESSLAEAREEIELWKQRVTFVEAKRTAEREYPEYGLAAYMLRDLPLTITAELHELAHVIHYEHGVKGDWEGLRDLWDKAWHKARKETV